MGLPIKFRHVPARLAAGAFILNSGMGKRGMPDDGAAGLQQMAAHAFPQLKEMSPKDFGKLISTGEIALGVALLTPLVPTWLAALGLAGFSGGLLRMYTKVPGLTRSDGIRPTADGNAIAKDVFLAGIAGTLLIDEITSRGR
ncbi:DoxX family membrane protein [Georgenia yuyongxinii]|uniref:DoxX family membrane protein n=1 Tax=Georgenia yuyongxinii TaxID=2589797 RepID=A0A552WL08_9MICO|nr:DoxX family membrane protein [Georgenia yuyongxinii]TRW43452.1 DoxX family membrane protein [Georgenia yuyongxinii]